MSPFPRHHRHRRCRLGNWFRWHRTRRTRQPRRPREQRIQTHPGNTGSARHTRSTTRTRAPGRTRGTGHTGRTGRPLQAGHTGWALHTRRVPSDLASTLATFPASAAQRQLFRRLRGARVQTRRRRRQSTSVSRVSNPTNDNSRQHRRQHNHRPATPRQQTHANTPPEIESGFSRPDCRGSLLPSPHSQFLAISPWAFLLGFLASLAWFIWTETQQTSSSCGNGPAMCSRPPSCSS
jgi:hypothetical protein